jgi:hypothetical protein
VPRAVLSPDGSGNAPEQSVGGTVTISGHAAHPPSGRCDLPRPHSLLLMPALPRICVRRVFPLLLASVLATSALSGCGAENREPAADPTAQTPSAPTSSSSAPSPSAAPSSSTATPTPSAPTPLAAGLLDAGDMPRLTGGMSDMSWSNGKTHAIEMTAFGVCQRFDLLSIGAEKAVERDFVAGKNAPAGATAAEQVAQMPDAMTAQRARKVLTSWHDTCRSRIKDVTSPDVGPVTTVVVPHGSAVWYDVRYTPTASGTRHSHAFGIVVSGTRIALLRLDSDAPAHSYPAGSEPMATAVKAASARLG